VASRLLDELPELRREAAEVTDVLVIDCEPKTGHLTVTPRTEDAVVIDRATEKIWQRMGALLAHAESTHAEEAK
jgi:hypothetical protein